MPNQIINHQRGAALAFSLIVLLLMTVISLSMIRQNKIQIGIATNAGLQARSFARVETSLRKALATLESLRYSDKANRHCKSGATNSVHPIPHTTGTLNIGDASVNVQITEEYCIWNYATGQGDERECLYSSPGVRNTTLGSPVPTDDNVQACTKLNNAGGWVAGTPNKNACPIEVYIIQATLQDGNSGAKRTVESKFEIDCSNDLNS